MLDITTVLASIAMCILAWEASGKERNPIATLAGLFVMLLAMAVQFFGSDGIIAKLAGFFADIGIAFLLASVVMFARKAKALPFFALSMIGMVLTGLILLGSALVRKGSGVIPGRSSDTASLVVELGPDDDIEEITPVLTSTGIISERAFPSVPISADEDLGQMYILKGPSSALEQLAGTLRSDRENVDFVEWNRTVSLVPTPQTDYPTAERLPFLADDPLAASQWALQAANVHEAHRLLAKLTPVRKAVVAILDTGVDAGHEDLKNVFHASPGRVDEQGHGTHCAGIAGAATNNRLGIASLNWEGRYIEIASFQALPTRGSGTYETIAQAIIDATQLGADVLSLSLGDYAATPPRVVEQAVEFALSRGAVVIASAGNANQDGSGHMPSNIPGVIAVAAVDRDLNKASFSNTNTRLSRPIAAPGVDILSLQPGGRYVSLSGTSMSTPLVAGLAGVLRALNPNLSAEEIYTILNQTGTSARDASRTGRIIDAEAAIKAISASI